MSLENRQILMNRNLVKAETHSMPDSVDVGIVARRKMDVAQSRAQMRDVKLDPSINPAGKAQFKGEYGPYANRSDHYTYAKPDSGHAARIRGAAARKQAPSWDDKARGK